MVYHRLARTTLVLLFPLLVQFQTGLAQEQLGVVSSQPESGRWVQLDRGYMVPYRVTIPGTRTSFEMVPIPAGTLRYTNDLETGDDAVLEVPIQPFWIARCEVTWEEYDQYQTLRRTFMKFSERRIRRLMSDHQLDAVTAPSTVHESPKPAVADPAEQLRHPAVSMTQFAARQYTKWLSLLTAQIYRLPTEAEWEYACRGDTESGLSPAVAWCLENSSAQTHPVGLLPANSWGLFDMRGNAAEWVLDADDSGRRRLRTLLQAGLQPIVWPNQEFSRLVCGGSWGRPAADCQPDSRLVSSARWKELDPSIPTSPHWLASDISREIGFRIVRPHTPPAHSLRQRFWDPDVPQTRAALRELSHIQRGPVDPQLPVILQQLEAAGSP
ncbi:MAG: formylglycine-generating enzyme family protein [Planctomycetaceae bacterium]